MVVLGTMFGVNKKAKLGLNQTAMMGNKVGTMAA